MKREKNLINDIYKMFKNRSFKSILIICFVFVSLLPILALQFFSYVRLSNRLQENMNELSEVNVAQIRNNLEISLEAYEDLLYQIYTGDEIVELVYDIDADNNTAVSMNQLRRALRALCYSKEGIESITVITGAGTAVYYDKLTASSVNSSWLGSEGLEKDYILEIGQNDNSTIILPSQYATTLANKPCYLFHMVHRIIDYKRIDENLGVVVLSLNEEILENICNQEMPAGSLGFIVDGGGSVVSYPNKDRLADVLPDYTTDTEKNIFAALLDGDGLLTDYTSIYTAEALSDWKIVTALNQSEFHDKIQSELRNLLFVDIVILLTAVLLIFAFITLLSRSMNKVADAMKQAQGGNLSAHISEERVFSAEMTEIVYTFNEMMQRINLLIEEIKFATNQRKDAEIKALEAQINPHFLYNILDCINWTAIDNEQYEVSRMITSLAKILRYSINNSNVVVTVKDELNWLEQYIYLHLMRLKNSFKYTLEADEELMDYPIHKLTFQPFIENSILHGFRNREKGNLLNVSITAINNGISICISDNGWGMETPGGEAASGDSHLGISNAVGRIRMYYGDEADIKIDSRSGIGTTVTIILNGGGNL